MADLDLISIELNNFKSFNGLHSFEFFPKAGLYLVAGKNYVEPELGPNGVGKSSLWDSLLWVLWGKTGRDRKPGDAVAPWQGEKQVQATLKFERHGRLQHLVRTRSPNSLRWNGKEITQDRVPGIIGMSEETFRRTIVLTQFGTLFLDLRAEEQAAMFSDALQLNIWLEASKKAAIRVAGLDRYILDTKTELVSLKNLLADLSEQMEAAKLRADKFDRQVQEDVDRLDAALKKAEAKYKKVKATHKEKPALPANPPRLVQLLEKIEEEPESLRRLIYGLGRRAGKSKVCSKCGQVIVNKQVEAAIQQAEADSRSRLEQWRTELKLLQSNRHEEDLVYQKVLDKWYEEERNLLALARDVEDLKRDLKEAEERKNVDAEEFDRLKLRRQQKRARVGEVEVELQSLEEDQKQAEFWVKTLKEIRLSIIDEVLLELEVAATRHAGMLGLTDWAIKFQTERETRSGNVSYGFNTFLYPPGEEKPVKWESYCGGEVGRWQLAVTFGLSEVLLGKAGVDPNVECLDEPTKGLSAEGVRDLLEHLRERALELNRAIYVVEHHVLDRGEFDGMLLVSKDKNGSSFSWV